MKNRVIPSAFALVLLASGTSSAAVIATPVVGGNGAFTVSSTDRADASQGGTQAFIGTPAYGSSPDKVIDGLIYDTEATNQTTTSLTPEVGSTLTLTLAASTYGWDISSIVALTGAHPDQSGRTDHSYTIAFITDGTNFASPFINVNDTTVASNVTGGEVQMTIADNTSAPLGTGVKAVRFVFGNATGATQNMYREFDVLGTATIPEPSAALLGGIGALLLLRRRRA